MSCSPPGWPLQAGNPSSILYLFSAKPSELERRTENKRTRYGRGRTEPFWFVLFPTQDARRRRAIRPLSCPLFPRTPRLPPCPLGLTREVPLSAPRSPYRAFAGLQARGPFAHPCRYWDPLLVAIAKSGGDSPTTHELHRGALCPESGFKDWYDFQDGAP